MNQPSSLRPLKNPRRRLLSVLFSLPFFPVVALNPKTVWGKSWRLDLNVIAQLPSLELLDGRSWSLNDSKGKVVILEFWHSQCPFCNRQNPLLNTFYKKHSHRGLDVITISIDKKKSDAQSYMAAKGYEFKAGLANEAWMALYQQRKGLPQLFVIDRQGIVRAIEIREMFPDDIDDLTRFLG